jgi:hypothetical protein
MSTGYVRILLDGAGLAVQCDDCDTDSTYKSYDAAKQAVILHKLDHSLTRQEHQ